MNAIAKEAKNTFHGMIEKFTVVEFNPKWENGTGYLDHAVKGENAPVLGEGETVQSMDGHGRKIGIVGTRIGNVVIFDRFSDTENSVVVSNMPIQVSRLLGFERGSLSIRNLELVFGECETHLNNIGKRIEAVM